MQAASKPLTGVNAPLEEGWAVGMQAKPSQPYGPLDVQGAEESLGMNVPENRQHSKTSQPFSFFKSWAF